MLVGFWFTYFTKLLDQENYRMHTHGVTLILWVYHADIASVSHTSEKVFAA
jgi:hypothetical protein